MTKSTDADVAPRSAEPPPHGRPPERDARRHVQEDSTSGSEFVDDRLRLDD
jgi:hypothetical protein